MTDVVKYVPHSFSENANPSFTLYFPIAAPSYTAQHQLCSDSFAILKTLDRWKRYEYCCQYSRIQYCSQWLQANPKTSSTYVKLFLMYFPVFGFRTLLNSGASTHSGCFFCWKSLKMYSLCLGLKFPTRCLHPGCSRVICCTSEYTSLDAYFKASAYARDSASGGRLVGNMFRQQRSSR